MHIQKTKYTLFFKYVKIMNLSMIVCTPWFSGKRPGREVAWTLSTAPFRLHCFSSWLLSNRELPRLQQLRIFAANKYPKHVLFSIYCIVQMCKIQNSSGVKPLRTCSDEGRFPKIYNTTFFASHTHRAFLEVEHKDVSVFHPRTLYKSPSQLKDQTSSSIQRSNE